MESLHPSHRTNVPKRQQQGLSLPRPDVYATVTEQILAQLVKGVIPWQSPSIARVGLPRNFATGRAYQGINVFLLAAREFQSPFFLTYLQARELKGQVRRGEHGSLIVKVGTLEKEHEANEAATPRPDRKGTESAERIRFLKAYTVFNACQIDGITFPEPKKCDTFSESVMAHHARRIMEAMPNPPKIHEGRKAFPHYIPELDEIELPSRETFRAEWRFWKTLFHEAIHSTGHSKRLNRSSLTHVLGTQAVGENRKMYCQEELVAEMGAAFLGAHAGIIEDDFQNSAAYLKGWMDALRIKDNKTWLVKAAAEAQRAADYILGASAPIS